MNSRLCAGEQRGRNLDAERLGGLEVEDRFVLGRRLYRQVGWLLSLEDAIDIGGRAGAVAEGTGARVSYRFFGRYSPKSIS
jgi:hypothetical protein